MAFDPAIQSDPDNSAFDGNLFVSNLFANGTVELGNITNVHIYGGTIGQLLATDGNGNLEWVSSVSADSLVNGTSNVTVAANANVTVGVAGISNVSVFNSGGLAVKGNLTANDISSANTLSAVGTLTAGNANVSGTANLGAVITDFVYGRFGDVTIQAAAGNFDINLEPTGTGNINASDSRIVSLANPVSPSDAATKQYVDGVSQGLVIKSPVALATTSALSPYTYNNGTSGVGATCTASSPEQLIIDGTIAILGSRVLVKNEIGANQAYNGIYVVTVAGDGSTPWVITRATDFDVNTEMYSGYTYVSGGADLAFTSWVCTNNATSSPVVIGSSPVTFVQFSDAAQYFAGSGLSLNGTVFSVNTDGVTTSVVAGNVVVRPSAQLTTPNIGDATGITLTLTGDISTGGNINAGNGISAANLLANQIVANNVTGTQNLSGGIIGATTSITAGTTITANGTITGGNLATSGNLNANNATLTGAAFVTGNVSAGNIGAGNAILSGALNAATVGATGAISAGGNITGGNVFATGAGFTGNVLAGNVNANGAVVGLTLGGNLTTAAQPNVTSLGILTGLAVAGTSQLGSNTNIIITGGSNGQALVTDGTGNLRWGGVVSNAAGNTGAVQYNVGGNFTANTNFTYDQVTGTLTAPSLVATTGANLGAVANLRITGGSNGFVLRTDGSANLTWVDPATIPASVSNFANFAGNITVPAQPNITSLGTLTGLTVTGTSTLGTVDANNINANTVSAGQISGTLTTGAQPNITAVGNLGSLTVTGDANIGGNITANGNITTARITSTVANGVAPMTITSSTRVANLNVDRAGVTDNVSVTTGTTGTVYPTFVGSPATGNFALGSNTGLSYNVATGILTANGFAGNISGTANTAVTVTGNAQPNINQLGTLSGLVVSGVTNVGPVGNLRIQGGLMGQYLMTDGSGNVSWANVGAPAGGSNRMIQFNDNGVFGGVAALTFNKTSNTLTTNTIVATTSANLGDVANVTITGGLENQVLRTDGYGLLSWANVSSLTVAAGANRQLQFNDGNAIAGAPALTYNKLTSTTTVGNLVVSNTSNLGDVANLTITGGSFGYFLQTDGNGTLSWVAGGGGGGNGTPGGANTAVQFNDSGLFGGVANFTFDKDTEVLRIGSLVAPNGANLGGNISNVVIGGGTSGQYLRTDGTGNLTWASVTGTAANPAGNAGEVQFNGGSNNMAASFFFNYASGNGTLRIGNVTSGTTTTIANGNVTAQGSITSRTLTLTAPPNVSPINVTSQVVVANLNSDLLRGLIPTSANTANTVVARDSAASFSANTATLNTLVVSNTSQVLNLNATRVGNFAPNLTSQANTLVVRDANGNSYSAGFVGDFYGTVVGTAPANSTLEIANVTMGNNDQFRIIVGGNSANTGSGYAEIATADDASEPIFVRQYSRVSGNPFGTLTRSASLLDETGNTSFPGTVTAPQFSGNMSGNTANFANIQTPGVNITSNGVVANTLRANTSISVGTASDIVTLNSANGITTALNVRASGDVFGNNIWANSGTVRGSLLTGTLTTASQPNITQVGTLTNLTVTDLITANRVTATNNIQAARFISTVAQGTAPLQVTSNTQVDNLNASLLQGYVPAFGSTPNSVVLRNSTAGIVANTASFGGEVQFQAFGPNVKPFSVVSRLTVTNLSAELLNGFSASQAADASTVVVRNSNGGIVTQDITARQLTLNIASPSAPMVVSSNAIVNNLNADFLDGYNASIASTANTVVVRDASSNISGANIIASQQLRSTVATGTAPLGIQSTTLVANLNAEFLGGFRANAQNFPGTVVVRDANGNVSANRFDAANSITAINGNITNMNVVLSANVGNNITANGNIRMEGNFFYAGNANAVVDTITANRIQAGVIDISGLGNGTSNINIPTANGNILFTVNNRANLYSFSDTALYTSTANISTLNTVIANAAVFFSSGFGNNIKVGDDVWLGDGNKGNTLWIRGQQDANAGWIMFGGNTTRRLGRGSGTFDNITVEGPFTVSKRTTDPGDSNPEILMMLQGAPSGTGSNDYGEAYLWTPRTSVVGNANARGTISITRSGGGYGALGFGTATDHVIARIGTGPLTWGGDFQFGNVWSNSGAVTLRTNTTVQGNLTITGNISTSGNTFAMPANSTVGGVEVGYRYLPTNIVPSGGNITLTLADSSKLFHQNGSASTINVPANASVPFPIGTVIVVFNSSAAVVDIKPLSGVTLVQAGVGNIATQARLSQWGQLSLTKFDTDRWSVTGIGYTAS